MLFLRCILLQVYDFISEYRRHKSSKLSKQDDDAVIRAKNSTFYTIQFSIEEGVKQLKSKNKKYFWEDGRTTRTIWSESGGVLMWVDANVSSYVF